MLDHSSKHGRQPIKDGLYSNSYAADKFVVLKSYRKQHKEPGKRTVRMYLFKSVRFHSRSIPMYGMVLIDSKNKYFYAKGMDGRLKCTHELILEGEVYLQGKLLC